MPSNFLIELTVESQLKLTRAAPSYMQSPENIDGQFLSRFLSLHVNFAFSLHFFSAELLITLVVYAIWFTLLRILFIELASLSLRLRRIYFRRYLR